MPIPAPDEYDPREFELYRRGFRDRVPMDQGRRMRKPGVYERETGAIHRLMGGNLSRALWAPTVFGCNAGYPDGGWAERSRIWGFHQHFMRGITHFMRTDPVVPAGNIAVQRVDYRHLRSRLLGRGQQLDRPTA